MTRTRLTRGVAAGIAALALLGATAVSASAATSECPSSTVCLRHDADYKGGVKKVGKNPGTYDVFSDFNDKMSSWYNKSTAYDARWYYNNNGTGTSRCMNSQSFSSWVGSVDDNQATSVVIFTDQLAC
jgi:Peptidase inhibitor family I36